MMYSMLKSPQKWILKGIPVLFIFGSLVHFLYELSGKNKIIGSFTPVNESIWEHMKLVLVPIILWWSLYYILRNEKHNIDNKKWYTSMLLSLIISLITIPILHYFYTQAFGVKSVVIDIIILFIALFFGQILGFHTYKYSKGINAAIALLLVVCIVFVFIVFTFNAPQLPIFKDNNTGTYGIQ